MSFRHSLFIAFMLPFCVHAQERIMRIGLLRDRTVKHAMVMCARGNCNVFADGVRMGELKSSDGLRIEVGEGGIVARSLSLAITGADRLEVLPQLDQAGFRLRSLDHKTPERTYAGSLEITAHGSRLELVNTVPIEAYTEGVVKAEAGNGQHVEYYKLQSVTCRTYALSNVRKHLLDGFQLCDGVHCQVYHGISRNDSIRMAVEATHGLVLVDPEIRLIHATFHSNCGGETVNAEDLWSKSEPYLRATVDTFCLSSPHATWQKTLTRKEWLAYLTDRYRVRTKDRAQLDAVLNYQPMCRDLYLANTWPLVPLKNVREDLKLRSTYFSVRTEGEHVVLEGRGFGHGVGLCQEGSMRMAKAGRSYTDILHTYYTDVHLVDLSTLDFFREEAPAPVVSYPSP
ncbi:MAG: SpoIID/LytB domain-containing protein [Flavobacteriales bacterium]|nr:SpoIID/LytB domain-containing protein [Flavobacteriales bacterium]